MSELTFKSWLESAASPIDWLAYSHLAVSVASTLPDARLLPKRSRTSHLAKLSSS